MADDLTPFTWICAAEGVLSTMDYWDTVDRRPMVLLGDPTGDLSQCGCSDDGGPAAGVALVTAGETFYTGEQFPDRDIRRRSFATTCSDEWAVDITVEFARCRPVFGADSRSPVPAEKRREYASRLYADGWAIWQAFRCAQAPWRQTIGGVIVGGWGPVERDLGPCAGFRFSYTGKVAPCQECPPS